MGFWVSTINLRYWKGFFVDSGALTSPEQESTRASARVFVPIRVTYERRP